MGVRLPTAMIAALSAAALTAGIPLIAPGQAQAGPAASPAGMAPAGSRGAAAPRPADPFGDAAIPRAAAVADAGKRFDQVDTNHDGALSGDELAALRPASRLGTERPGAQPGGKRRRAGFMLDRFDTNHDGRLSRDEFVAGQLARFDRMDTDHDGALSAAERRAAAEAMRQRMTERRARQQVAREMGSSTADGSGDSFGD